MGVDAIGRRPKARAGKLFMANISTWGSIHTLIVELCSDLLDDATLTSIGGSDGFGPTKQSVCTQMADRFQQWMDGRPGNELKLPRARKRAIARNVLDEWVAFLRNCGGFKTY